MGNYIFDIDGTLSEQGKPVSKNICDSIERLSERNTVAFASARPVRDMLPMVKETLHSKSTFIGCNGGMVFKNGAMVYCEMLSADYVANTISILKKLKIPYVLDGSWGFSVSSDKHRFHEYIRSLSSHEEDEQSLISHGITKILVLSDADNINDLLLQFNHERVSIHTHSKESFFDLTVKGNNKYNSIRKFIGNEYTAFGNDKNDFLMLDNAKLAIFVGNETEYRKANIYLKFEEVSDFIKKCSFK